MSNKNWQVQKQLRTHTEPDGDTTPEWRDVVTVQGSNSYGCGSKAQAQTQLVRLRDINPRCKYRIVKVSPL